MFEDRLLCLAFKRGSDRAFRRIYAKHRGPMLKLAVGLLRDEAAAEDVVQDVFLRMVQSADRLRVRGSLKAYLRVCVLHAARGRFRKKVREAGPLGEMDPPAVRTRRPEEWLILDEQSRRLLDALARIPQEQREAVVLHLQGDMTFRQIAELCEVPAATIQSRYRYGLKKLRSILDGEVRP